MINVIKKMMAILDVFKIYNPAYMNLYSRIAKGYSLKLPSQKNLNNKPADKLTNITNYNESTQDSRGYKASDKINSVNNITGYIGTGDISKVNEPADILKDNYYPQNTGENYNLKNINWNTEKIISNMSKIYSSKDSINNSYTQLYSYQNFRNPIPNINFISNSNNINSETYTPNNIKYDKILGYTVDKHTINYNNKLGDILANTFVSYNNYTGNTQQTSTQYLSSNTKKFPSNNYNNENYNNYNYYNKNTTYSGDINSNHIDIDRIIQLLKQELLQELNSSTKGVY